MAAELPPGWTPGQELPSHITVPAYCGGGFVPPLIPSIKEEGMSIKADEVLWGSNRSEFRGGVRISDGKLFLQTEEAYYDLPNERLELPQGFELAGYSLLAVGERMEYQHNARTFSAERLDFSLPNLHAWGHAASLSAQEKEDKVSVRLREARVSFCDPTENTWQLSARRLDLNLHARQGHARGLRFYIGKAPVMWFPYLRFPLGGQRQSGLLYPSFAVDSEDGFIYSQPAYFNLRPNLDTTTYAHSIEKRGFLLEQELRWLTSAGGGTVGFGYLPRDALVQKERTAQHFHFTSQVDRGWAGEIQLTSVSDIDYVRNLPTFFEAGDDLTLARSAHARYDDKNIHWQFGVQNYQLLVDQSMDTAVIAPYTRLPYTRLAYVQQLGSGFVLKQDAEYILFSRPDGAVDRETNVYTGDDGRFFNALRLQWGEAAPQGSVLTAVNWDFLNYQFSADDAQLPDPSGSRLGMSFDTRLVYSAPSPVCDCYVSFEPRLYGLYAEYQPTEEASVRPVRVFDTAPRDLTYDVLFTDQSFTGHDRLRDEQRVSLGFESRLIDRAGAEEYRLRLARAAYLEREEFATGEAADDLSPWAFDLAWFLAQGGYIETGLVWDELAFINRHLAVHAFDEAAYDVVFAYYGREETLDQASAEQIGTGLVWQVHARWSVFGDLRYDLLAEDQTSQLIGFGYENCCSRVITGFYERQIAADRATGLVLRFVFKPWGGTIGTSDKRLSDADQIYNSILYGIDR